MMTSSQISYRWQINIYCHNEYHPVGEWKEWVYRGFILFAYVFLKGIQSVGLGAQKNRVSVTHKRLRIRIPGPPVIHAVDCLSPQPITSSHLTYWARSGFMLSQNPGPLFPFPGWNRPWSVFCPLSACSNQVIRKTMYVYASFYHRILHCLEKCSNMIFNNKEIR